MSLSEINIREKKFHNQLHSSGGHDRIQQSKFYKALYSLHIDFMDTLKVKTRSKDVLDYGCGTGNFAEKVRSFQPKKIVAVDISEEAIKKAKNKSDTINKEIEYRVENCEKLNLGSDKFDVVYGGGILHHLDLNKSLNELSRVLKKDGTIIFVEPLATNPLINLYRKFTPKARSADEHPFSFNDIKLIKSIFKNVEVKYYGFLTLIFFPFYKSPQNSKIFKFLSILDKVILNTKYLKFLAWSVLIEAKKN
tara:strand:+ start:1489 stop:2238 length:750 start_codon:yes stop_codon:yes gene_type:complete